MLISTDALFVQHHNNGFATRNGGGWTRWSAHARFHRRRWRLHPRARYSECHPGINGVGIGNVVGGGNIRPRGVIEPTNGGKALARLHNVGLRSAYWLWLRQNRRGWGRLGFFRRSGLGEGPVC